MQGMSNEDIAIVIIIMIIIIRWERRTKPCYFCLRIMRLFQHAKSGNKTVAGPWFV